LALLLVLFIIMGLSSIILSLSEDVFTLKEYTERTVDYENIYSISNKVEVFLTNLFQRDNPDVDYLGEAWSKELIIPSTEGEIKILIVDQERYLNPNKLITEEGKINKEYFRIFERLFSILGINRELLYNIIDWIDKNKTSDGGEEIYKDYLAKNDYLDTPEELLLIKGFNEKIFYGDKEKDKIGLKEFITTFSNGKVNINTAPKYVLMALDENIDGILADKIISERKKNPFKTVSDIRRVDGIDIRTYFRIRDIIDVKSENFIAYFDIKLGDRIYKVILLFKRNNKNIKKVWIKVL